MSFNWESYIDLSHVLIDLPDIPETKTNEEACFRSAISRSYYGVFCIARDLLPSYPTDRTVHYSVINTYKTDPSELKKKVGKDLDRLRRQRNNADYQTNINIIKNDALQACEIATRTLTNLKNIQA